MDPVIVLHRLSYSVELPSMWRLPKPGIKPIGRQILIQCTIRDVVDILFACHLFKSFNNV